MNIQAIPRLWESDLGYDGEDDVFVTPKPVKLIDRILQIPGKKGPIVLDSSLAREQPLMRFWRHINETAAIVA